MRKLLALLMIVAVVPVHADNRVIGTISFSLDGDEQTWFVLESPSGLRPNALWLDLGPDRAAISVTAFSRPDIMLVSHDTMNSAVPEGSAPALVVSIAFPKGATEYSHALPAPADDGPAVIMMLNDWSNPIDSTTLSDGPGEIRLTAIESNRDAPSSFAGTFEGALKDGEGNARPVTAGQFEFDEVKYFERP